MLLAALSGNLQTVKWLLSIGASLGDKNDYGSNVILKASRSGNLELIKYLVEEQSFSLQDMNTTGTCIMVAAREKHVDACVWMLSNGSSIEENTALCRKTKRIITRKSCKDTMKENGLFNTIKSYFTNQIIQKIIISIVYRQIQKRK